MLTEESKTGTKAEAARERMLAAIVAFIRTENTAATLRIKLHANDAEAVKQGWASAATQREALQEILSNLPVDVMHRIKVG